MSATDILVTAFMPFGGDSLNPTQLVLERLGDELCGRRINKLLLPVEFKTAGRLAADECERLSPAAVIMLGQAGGRSKITPERRAVNLMEARIPDNAGYEPHSVPVIAGGAERLYSTLPLDLIVSAIRARGLPAGISEDAGAYVCNCALYTLLSRIDGRIPAGFIHVPFIREQTEGVNGRGNSPFMELDEITEAVNAAMTAVSSWR
ncbi:MAG: pyroglutamyl-peptidase I [Clostridiales bacterium]|nr:pyroglutamyl-peptidase I [Clostridiales bacterium]